MRVIGLAALVLASTGARAADYTIAPPAAWIQPVKPPATVRNDGAIDVRLADIQTRLDSAGLHQYLHQVVRVLQPQALQAVGSFGAVWQPATDRIVFHRVVIHRGDQDIDVLKDGAGLQVIRREAGLEAALIDGRLTATMPVPDLRVGDEIEFAYTIDTFNPVLGTHREADQFFARSTQIDRLYLRNSWPSTSGIRWRAGAGLPKPAVSKSADGQTVLTIDQANYLAPGIPAQSPGRFIDANRLQVSDFPDWQSLSALFAPIFDQAAVPAADSPLKAEIARIASAYADPKARALAALQLVQSQVRYLARMDGLGGYQPASADAVWKERLGDCKGKTVLLLALLRALGIDAQAAIVSVQQSDGVDASLPLAGRFDHVIVRATIGGKAYWLDGTRLGDRDLDQIAVPGFQWALPLTRPGSGLVRLVATEPALPTEEWTLDLDARGGISVPAKATGVGILRGDGASGVRTALSFLSETQRDEALRKMWAERHDWVEIKDVTYSADEKSGEVRIGFTGTGKMDWSTDGADAAYRYQANKAFLGQILTPQRSPGDPDAPVKVDERYTVTHQTILLPDGGKGFYVDGEAIDRTEGGLHYVRTASIHDGKFEMTASTRSKAGEISLAAAKAADKQATEIFNKDLYVHLPDVKRQQAGGTVPVLAAADDDDVAAKALYDKRDWLGLLKVTDAALAKNPKNISMLLFRGNALRELNRLDQADIAFDAALAVDGKNALAIGNKAQLLWLRNRYEDSLILYDRLILLYPDMPGAYVSRGRTRWYAGQRDGAIADMKLAVDQKPDDFSTRFGLALMLVGLHRYDEAIAQADAVIAANPEKPAGYNLKGNLLAEMGRKDEARAVLNRSLAIAQTLDAYLLLLCNDMVSDDKTKLEDMTAVIAKAPGVALPPHQLRSLSSSPGAYATLISAYDKAEQAHPGQEGIAEQRDEVEIAFGHSDRALARLDKLIADKPGDAAALNAACWARATHRIDLDKALIDCNASLAVENGPGALDSRGLVHLQRGEFQAAIADYDAALAKYQALSTSLFGRGLAKRKLGNEKDGNADLAAARMVDLDVDKAFLEYGLKP